METGKSWGRTERGTSLLLGLGVAGLLGITASAQGQTEGRDMQGRIEAILKRHEDEVYGVLTEAEHEALAGMLDKLARHSAGLAR